MWIKTLDGVAVRIRREQMSRLDIEQNGDGVYTVELGRYYQSSYRVYEGDKVSCQKILNSLLLSIAQKQRLFIVVNELTK